MKSDAKIIEEAIRKTEQWFNNIQFHRGFAGIEQISLQAILNYIELKESEVTLAVAIG